MILAFYIARTILPLGMRIAAVYLLKEDADKLLTTTPDPDPLEEPPSLEHLDRLLLQYKAYHSPTPDPPSQDADP